MIASICPTGSMKAASRTQLRQLWSSFQLVKRIDNYEKEEIIEHLKLNTVASCFRVLREMFISASILDTTADASAVAKRCWDWREGKNARYASLAWNYDALFRRIETEKIIASNCASKKSEKNHRIWYARMEDAEKRREGGKNTVYRLREKSPWTLEDVSRGSHGQHSFVEPLTRCHIQQWFPSRARKFTLVSRTIISSRGCGYIHRVL